MPTQKTIATEVSVILGLLNTDWQSVCYDKLPEELKTSFSEDHYRQALDFYRKEPSLCNSLTEAGKKLKLHVPEFSDIAKIEWKGPSRLARSVISSQDILANNIPISVKVESNVVYNLSPENMFIAIPSGFLPRPDVGGNWYIKTAYDSFNRLYLTIKDVLGFSYDTVLEFEKKASKDERKRIQKFLKLNQKSSIYNVFMDAYTTMCQEVARESAHIFNDNISLSLKEHPKALFEVIAKIFLRLNGIPYLLVCMEKHTVSSLWVPDLTTFLKQYKILDVVAQADSTRRQSVVNILLRYTDKNKSSGDLSYHVEIRWSHGKFCGNPEAKLYKHFLWKEVPGFKVLCEVERSTRK